MGGAFKKCHYDLWSVTAGIYWGSLACEKPENYYFNGWEYYLLRYDNGNPVYTLANDFDRGNIAMVNHEVVIVGWDDNYSKDNFRYVIDRDVELLPDATASNALKALPESEPEPSAKKARVQKATDSNADMEIPEHEDDDDDRRLRKLRIPTRIMKSLSRGRKPPKRKSWKNG